MFKRPHTVDQHSRFIRSSASAKFDSFSLILSMLIIIDFHSIRINRIEQVASIKFELRKYSSDLNILAVGLPPHTSQTMR